MPLVRLALADLGRLSPEQVLRTTEDKKSHSLSLLSLFWVVNVLLHEILMNILSYSQSLAVRRREKLIEWCRFVRSSRSKTARC